METDLPTELSKAFREIERLRTALKEVTECYVDKFGGQIQGIKDSVPLHRPCEIARSALKDQSAVETFAEKVARLRREIAIRQAELHRLVCGNPAKGVSGPKPIDWPEYLELKDQRALKIRSATLDDSARIMEWRNDPVTISNFRTDKAVPPEEHIPWFAAQLKNPNTFCYIGCEDEIPCGVVWFRKNPSSVMETSVNVAPYFRGRGLSKLMLRGAISAIGLDNNGFSTEIKTTNFPSIKMFEACGYILVYTALAFGTYYRPKWQTWVG